MNIRQQPAYPQPQDPRAQSQYRIALATRDYRRLATTADAGWRQRRTRKGRN